jgi:hypothetical protein
MTPEDLLAAMRAVGMTDEEIKKKLLELKGASK